MLVKPMRLTHTLSHDVPCDQYGLEYPDAYGVEIELEGMNLLHNQSAIQRYWMNHNDGSLRAKKPGDQAIEYVFRHPYNLDDTKMAIDLLFDFLNQPEVQVYESYRTSIHVHVNCITEQFIHIYNFMTLCLLLDELLVSQNGDHRIGNNFCLRAKDAMGQVHSILNSIESGNELYGVGGNERYSSINFASLLKFGTIEFRSLECTTHKGRLMHWINTLARIKAQAKTYKNPTEIIGDFSRMGPKTFLQNVLGPYAIKYMNVPGCEQMLHEGMRIAQDLAFCSEWRPSEPMKKINDGWARPGAKMPAPPGWAVN